MVADPLAPRTLAAAFAVGGLVVLMVQDAPSWHAIAAALTCLVAFTGLWFLPRRRTASRAHPRRIRIEIIPTDVAPARPMRLLQGPPGGSELLEPGRSKEALSLRPWQKPRWR